MSMPRMRPLAILPLVFLCGCSQAAPVPGQETADAARDATLLEEHAAAAAPTATRWRPPAPTQEGEPTVSLSTPSATPEPTPRAPDPSGLSPAGPWLLYFHYDGLRLVNQDGSGQTPVHTLVYDIHVPDATLIFDSGNRLAQISMATYLIRPKRAEAVWIHRSRLNWEDQVPEYRSIGLHENRTEGFLTSLIKDEGDGHLELVLHLLPSGEIVERISAIACDDCGISEVNWSPAGRYFAFTATLDTAAHNFYVYDTQRKKLQRLTTGNERVELITWSPHEKYLAFAPTQEGQASHLMVYDPAEGAIRRLADWMDHVSGIWWSPDDERILAALVADWDPWAFELDYALWSVRVSDGEAQCLHSSRKPTRYQYGIHWLDARRFVFVFESHEPEPSYRLVLVDLATGVVDALYCCSFIDWALDPESLVVAVAVTDDTGPGGAPWYEGPGIYMDSPSSLEPKLVWEPGMEIENLYWDSYMRKYMPFDYWTLDWDQELKMFVTDAACDMGGGNTGVRAIDRSGRLHCIQNPAQRWVSPDGEWVVVDQGGIWLKTAGGETIGRVSYDQFVEVIWGPDSRGFFLHPSFKDISYVSVPDLTTRLVERDVPHLFDHQWLTADLP